MIVNAINLRYAIKRKHERNQTNLFNKTKIYNSKKFFFACNKIPLLTINNLII